MLFGADTPFDLLRRRAGEVMLDGVEVIEDDDSGFEDFEDSTPGEQGSAMSQKLQLVRRELFEIRDLLSASH